MGMTRREAIRKTGLAVAAGGLGVPAVVPDRALGRQGPVAANERIAVAVIGLHNMGNTHLDALLRDPQAEVVALCDVDSAILADRHAKLEERYGHRVRCYGDFRRLLERKDLDAVFVATPDHWHALISIAALEAGKDVYCEKPLTLRIAEGRAIVNAVERTGGVFQTGSQQRSSREFRQACSLARNGKLGPLQRVEVGIPGGRAEGDAPDGTPPPELDYDFWLGPAPLRPYNPLRSHYDYRWFWDYSGGQMTNWGSHHIDIAHWGMGMDGSGPKRVEGRGDFPTTGILETATSYDLTYTYDTEWGEVIMAVNSTFRGGTKFIGTEGWVWVDRGKIEAEPADLLEWPFDEGDVKLYVSQNHQQNFWDAVRTRTPCICEAEIGHRSVTACHLGNVVIRGGQPVEWDPVKERFVDSALDQWLMYDYRSPWELTL